MGWSEKWFLRVALGVALWTVLVRQQRLTLSLLERRVSYAPTNDQKSDAALSRKEFQLGQATPRKNETHNRTSESVPLDPTMAPALLLSQRNTTIEPPESSTLPKQQQRQQRKRIRTQEYLQNKNDNNTHYINSNNNFTLAELANNVTLFDSLFNNSDYPATSTIPWSNLTTCAYYWRYLPSGFRNQMMAFTSMVLNALEEKGCGQLLLNSVTQKDTYGSNQYIWFHHLWNVNHWNAHYPVLPRLVQYDPILHDQYNVQARQWYPPIKRNNGTSELWPNRDHSHLYDDLVHPIAIRQKYHHLMGMYMRYTKGKGPLGRFAAQPPGRHPAEIAMLQGGLQPHHELQALVEAKLQRLVSDDHSKAKKTLEYIALHARIEPDMQHHPVCRDKKVLQLDRIVHWMEQRWPVPPASRVFLPVHRDLLVEHVTNMRHGAIPWDNVTVANLQTLDTIATHGLWNGTVPVFEFGAKELRNTPRYQHKRSTAGALLNFFIALNATVFIGTEVSSFSHDLLATRWYRNQTNNYKYLPNVGLVEWTPPGTKSPPGFAC